MLRQTIGGQSRRIGEKFIWRNAIDITATREAELIKEFFSAENGGRKPVIEKVWELNEEWLGKLEKTLMWYLNLQGKKDELKWIINEARMSLEWKRKTWDIVKDVNGKSSEIMGNG